MYGRYNLIKYLSITRKIFLSLILDNGLRVLTVVRQKKKEGTQ